MRTSSISTDDEALQATLVVVGNPEATVAHYRAVLVAQGFHELPRGGAGGARTATFVAGRDTVVLTTTDATTSLVADLHRERNPEQTGQGASDPSSSQSQSSPHATSDATSSDTTLGAPDATANATPSATANAARATP